jgi:hypothetical protein
MPTSQSQDSGSECSKFFKDSTANGFTPELNVSFPSRVIKTVGKNIIYQMTLVCATGDRKF